MTAHHDPSVIFTPALPDKSLEKPTSQLEDHSIREWLSERPPLYPPPNLRNEKNKAQQSSEPMFRVVGVEEPKKW